ncbi:MAG TPA: argininosuccinate lyase [Terriglobia bacterium]|nr:argininosuccinate lyase [Terriglobia bacterium]
MKLWGGRFARAGRDPLFEKFSQSFSVDRRLILYDLRVNQAYVKALGRAHALSPTEVRRLTHGLESLRRKVERNPRWHGGQSSEDVHTWVEQHLEASVGPVARKLRTGRSRNDLVATETRLYVKWQIPRLQGAALELLEALVGQGRRHFGAVMPGYTHLQPAQPILFSHYLLAYFEMLLRDWDRLENCRARADELPLGAAALAGTSFPLDRKALAKDLGFERAARNSLDVTSDRDFVAELLFICSLTMVHLSRLAEDLIIFSSPSFGYVELADTYSTGSSIMPQKKNPDSLELIRGKTATIIGRVGGILALLKGLPLAYDRDLQEDKAALFDAVETTYDALMLAARVIGTLRVRPERMRAATTLGFLTATEIADELVRRGVPFADAHEQVGKLVRLCVERGGTFDDVSDDEARRAIAQWDAGLRAIAVSPERAVRRKDVFGGTSPSQVTRQLREAPRTLARLQRQLNLPALHRER